MCVIFDHVLVCCSNLMYVVLERVGDFCGLRFVGCCLIQFKIVTLGNGLCYLSVSQFLYLILVCQHGI